MTPRGHVKVLDFGLAKISAHHGSSDTDTQSLTSVGGGGAVIMGTAAYMSPEQAKGDSVDQRSDLFSLGAVLYECVTGSRPFTGANLVEVCGQVLHVDPAPPSMLDARIPDAADKVILKLLSKAPEARYQSAPELRDDIATLRSDLRGEQQVNTLPIQGIDRALRRSPVNKVFSRSRRASLFALAGAIVLAAALLVSGKIPSWRPATPYEPKGEAIRRYDEGVNALRDGAYFKATRHLGLAIQADNQFALAHARLAEAWLELDHRKKAESEMLLARSLADRVTLSHFEDAYLQAANRTLVRDLNGAIEKYKEALALATGEEKAVVYFDLGRAYERNEDLAPARESYNSALAINPGNAAVEMRLGVLAAREMDSGSAEARFREAERRYREVDNLEGVTEAVFLRGYLLNTKDQLTDARTILEEALVKARALENQPQQVAILLHLSNIACSEGNTTKAESVATDAIGLAKREEMESLAVESLIAVGNAFLVRGDLDAAERRFQDALGLARSYEGEIGEKRALLALASANERRSKMDEVVRLVSEALPFLERGNYKREMAQALTLLARVHRKKGEYDQAIRIYAQSLDLLTQLEDRAEMASCHTGIGLVLSYREQYNEALDQYVRGSSIHESLRDEYNRGYDAMNTGRMLFQLGRYDEAETSFKLASDLARGSIPNNLHLWRFVEIYAARMALSQGRLDVAESKSKKALRLAGPNDREETILAKMTIGESMARSGRVRDGLKFCRAAEALAIEVANPRHLSEARLALARALLLSDEFEAAFEMAQKAEADFDRLGKRDSLWRALVVEAVCRERLGDSGTARAVATRAAETLSVVRTQLGKDASSEFLSKPDVVQNSTRLSKLLGEK